MTAHVLGRLRVLVLLAVALLLQATVASDLRVDGAAPDLLLLLAVTAGLTGGARQGVLVGFAAGLLSDLYTTGTPVGLAALSLCLVGFGVGTSRETVTPDARALTPVLAFLGGIAAILLYLALGELVGQAQLVLVGRADLIRIALIESLWTAVLAVPACWLYRRAARGTAGVEQLGGVGGGRSDALVRP